MKLQLLREKLLPSRKEIHKFTAEAVRNLAILTAIMVALVVLAICCGCELQISEEPGCPDGQCPNGACPLLDDQPYAPIYNPLDCDNCPYEVKSLADIPQPWREHNWGGGSCMYASLVPILRWQGRFEDAEKIRRSYSGGQSVDGLAVICNRMGLKFAYTNTGDAGFLEWCSSTRRGAAIHYFPNHAVTFCGFEDAQAVLIDNNRPKDYIRIPKATFISRWRGYGGRALTVVYTVPPPLPWLPQPSPDDVSASRRWRIDYRGPYYEFHYRGPRPVPGWRHYHRPYRRGGPLPIVPPHLGPPRPYVIPFGTPA